MTTTEALRAYDAAAVLDRTVKGYPLDAPPMPLAEIAGRGWSAVDPAMTFPLAVLHRSALAANTETMRRYCAAAGVDLAPHAKTTMAPVLVADQLDAGAWALTAANPSQALRLWDFGVGRVVLANEVADRAALGVLTRRLADDLGRELLLFVDSSAGVSLAADAVAAADGDRRLPVVVDLGHAAGRTGVRDVDAALALTDSVTARTGLRLAGVGGFEGTIGTDRRQATLDRVDAYLRFARDVATRLLDAGAAGAPDVGTGACEPFVVTFGGSAYFDRVVEIMAPARARGARVVLRSGCYLVHDHGLYARSSPGSTPGWRLPSFAAALEVWARVISRPEPGLVLLNAGKHDLSFDAGLPVAVAGVATETGAAVDVSGLAVSALSDHHAFVPVPPDCPLGVGDLMGLGVSHPCTTFDRWPLLYLVDDDRRITGAVRTYV